MPHLSIIIPHRRSDQRLESTLLSVLENRPEDSEIIIVHDGSYADPYDLADEVIFVQADPQSNTAQLLNAGVMATGSPAICVLLDGVEVSRDWCESPLQQLAAPGVATVAVPVDHGSPRNTCFGISAKALRRTRCLQNGRLEAMQGTEPCAGPTLTCGFYRRKTLLSLGGWSETQEESLADVELAYALHALDLHCVCDANSRVSSNDPAAGRKLSSTAMSQLASLSRAHGAAAPSLWQTAQDFLSDCLCGNPLRAVAWARGLRQASSIRQTQVRLAHAKQQFAAQQADLPLRIYRGNPAAATMDQRRAA
ncbi:MAG: glycosyltransferase [Planctomycetales bacterium]|nr:glycosyltransferase [Planctomycetales bacterium]